MKKKITVSLSTDILDMLGKISNENGLSKSAVISICIKQKHKENL